MTATPDAPNAVQNPQRHATSHRFARNAVITVGLLAVLMVIFWMYYQRERAVNAAAQTRFNSRVLGDELRQSSDELTRMARSYAITGDTVYRKRYYEILAIREGKLPRPLSYSAAGWQLRQPARAATSGDVQRQGALIDIMRGAGFTDGEFGTINKAKAISDSLTNTEFRAMQLASRGEADRRRAIEMLFDSDYSSAKAAIMESIDDFLVAVDERTLAAVDRATGMANMMRLIFVAVGILLLFALARTYAALRGTMGGSVIAVHRRIAALGSGNAPATDAEKGPANSVLGWLSEADARLADNTRERARSEERMRAVVESALDCIISMNAEGCIIEFNPAAEKTLGYKREDVIGKSLAEIIIPPRFRAAHGEGLRRVLSTGVGKILGQRIELPALCADGGEVLVELAITRLGSETPPVFTGFLRDISERKRGEKRLHEQASLLDHAQDAIIVRDLDDRVMYWNKGAERLYGWTAAEAMGRSVVALFFRDPAPFRAATAHVMKEGQWLGELQKFVKNGSMRTVESRWTLVRDGDGNPTSVMLIDTDVTEKKNLEQQFFRAQRMESIGTLAGGIAHDLNNVLAPIMMSVDLLRQTVTAPDDRELLDNIAVSSRRGADMVAQVLSFARGMDGRRIQVRAKHLIGDAEKLVTDTFPKNIAIKTLVRPDLWTIVGDPTQLHQVMVNLCVNARDAMPDGGHISITAENEAIVNGDGAATGTPSGNYVRIEVEDTGAGMSSDVLARIFDPFFTTKDIGKGTGLGLSTSLGIVTSHGGSIRVDSEIGRGTRFRILLPAQAGGIVEESVMSKPEIARGKGELVLIVDDEASIRQITAQTLEAFGYRALVAGDGAEAIAVYAQHQHEIAVVITDMMMPVLDGPSMIQVLQRIKPNVRIIAVSGGTANRAQAGDAAKAVKHYLAKPFTAETLLSALQVVLSER
jgi:PAS domain S-box-containing protein